MNGERIGYIGLGSNLGDRKMNILEAIKRLSGRGIEMMSLSGLYETPPWGDVVQDDFLNAVVKVKTVLPPLQLLETLLEVEQDMGRVRIQKWGPRSIDLDLLLMGDDRVSESTLELPHPFLEDRLFVLLPLADLAPDLLLPFSGMPIGERIAQFSEDERRSIHLVE